MKSKIRQWKSQASVINSRMDNFASALTSLESLNKTFDIFVPSLNKKIKFKGLTTKQQKDAVKTALDKNITGITFSNLLNKIISENSLEKNNFLLIDRSYIILSLRVQSLSNTLQTEEGVVDLSFVPSNNISLPDSLKKQEITDGNIKLSVSIPTLDKDTFVNNETRKKLAPIPDNDDFAKESIGEIFVNELIKYIDVITINEGPQPVNITLNELTFEQKVQLVEKLPLNINSKLVEYINNVKTFERKYVTDNGKEIELDIDPTLFTV